MFLEGRQAEYCLDALISFVWRKCLFSLVVCKRAWRDTSDPVVVLKSSQDSLNVLKTAF